MKPIIKEFESYNKTIPQILTESGLAGDIKDYSRIILKPNLTTALPMPTTTCPEMTEQVIMFCKKNSNAEIIIAEGSGGCDTNKAFKELGYFDLVEKYGIKTLDLNRAEREKKENPNALKLKKVFLPKIAFESYIINMAVLKVHNESAMTAAMKNVFGFYLNQEYLNKNGQVLDAKAFEQGWWNKNELHSYGVNETIVDLNNYIKFNFNIVDASIGQLGSEIRGHACSPPVSKIVAGFDPEQVDKACAPLLGLKLEEIKYLSKS